MSKSPKARRPRKARLSTTRTVVTSDSLAKALRRRKPTKKLVELMRHKPVWERTPVYDRIVSTFIKMVELDSKEGRTAGYAVLETFGVKTVRDLKPMQYDAVLLAAEAALANMQHARRFDGLAEGRGGFCAWCQAPAREPHKPGCRALHTTAAVQAENDKLTSVPGSKPSNPKDALGILKVPASTLSAPVSSEVGIAMLEGALKYGRHNYRAIGVRASVYYDAVVARHMALWWEGEDEDPDTCELSETDTGFYNGEGKPVVPGTGLSHITKAIAGLYVIRDAMIQGKFIDDRPPRSPRGWQTAHNKKVKALLKKYPTAVPPYIEGDERMK